MAFLQDAEAEAEGLISRNKKIGLSEEMLEAVVVGE